jgi:hypothetical protein
MLEQILSMCVKFIPVSGGIHFAWLFPGDHNQLPGAIKKDLIMSIMHLPEIDRSIDGNRCAFFLSIWQLIIYSIDIKWIMAKESIDGSLDYTCTSIRGNPSKRVFRPPFWHKSFSDAFD